MIHLSNQIIDEQDVVDTITIPQVNRAVGPDYISHKMLKSTNSTIAKPLIYIYTIQQVIDRKYVSIFLENCIPYSSL